MASWVITMSKDYPQHWEIAKQHGLWDMTSSWQIDAGDDVYFWQAGGGSFLGRTRATSDAQELSPSNQPPWEDSGEREYVARFTFDLLSDAPTSQPKWGEVLQRLSMSAMTLQAPRRFADPSDEAVLASYFGAGELTPEESLDDERRAQVFADLSEDLRVRTLQVIALRQGQSGFRKSLLTAYSGACAVTGTATERVLEAAHIAPYKGEHTNQSSNGLLLRADIHTLFDLHLITITPDHVVHVSAEVEDAEYSQYDGQGLAHLPQTLTDIPDGEQLTKHNSECAWLQP